MQKPDHNTYQMATKHWQSVLQMHREGRQLPPSQHSSLALRQQQMQGNSYFTRDSLSVHDIMGFPNRRGFRVSQSLETKDIEGARPKRSIR